MAVGTDKRGRLNAILLATPESAPRGKGHGRTPGTAEIVKRMATTSMDTGCMPRVSVARSRPRNAAEEGTVNDGSRSLGEIRRRGQSGDGFPPILIRQARVVVALAWALVAPAFGEQEARRESRPLMRIVDVNLNETVEATLHNGAKARLKLLKVTEQRDSIRKALRRVTVSVEVNGALLDLDAAGYNLPKTVAGVRIDCPVTKGYATDSGNTNPWGLLADARFRLWPEGSPLTEEGTLILPLRDRWFAGAYQTGNEPVYVNGIEPVMQNVYYHFGMDFGGAEGSVDIVAPTDGLVLVAGNAAAGGEWAALAAPRNDRICILDDCGWIHTFSHLCRIDPAIVVNTKVKMGQKIGLLGKEGDSGGWAHLHWGIKMKQPSGLWGDTDIYPLAWEANLRRNKPRLVAVARPHRFAKTGEKVQLDGSRSWSAGQGPLKYEWKFTDGGTAHGARVDRSYEKPGYYSEILQVTDPEGRVDCDFQIVHVHSPGMQGSPTIHAAYAPTQGIKPGDPVTFKARTFNSVAEEIWDFGDGSPPVRVKSDGGGYAATQHSFTNAGSYIVSVTHSATDHGIAVDRLHVVVEKP